MTRADEEDPVTSAWLAAGEADGLSTSERRAIAARRVVTDDECADWGWCIRCRLASSPSHCCFYPRGSCNAVTLDPARGIGLRCLMASSGRPCSTRCQGCFGVTERISDEEYQAHRRRLLALHGMGA